MLTKHIAEHTLNESHKMNTLIHVRKVRCPYCKKPTVFQSNEELYGEKVGTGYVYRCKPCDAYVGCHSNGRPYGTPANKELRQARIKAHRIFDKLWVGSDNQSEERSRYYRQLASFMKKPEEKTHIGMFSLEECEKVHEFYHYLYPNE